MTNYLPLLALLLLSLNPVFAQELLPAPPPAADTAAAPVPEQSLSANSNMPEAKRLLNTPAHRFASRNPNLSRYVLGPALATCALAATYHWVDHDMHNDLPNDQSPFKEKVAELAEPLGRGITIQPGFGALMAYGLVAKDKRARKTAAIGVAAYYLNDGVSSNLKRAFSRMRPSSGADHDEWFKGEPHRSFPSSHTSTAFCAATVISTMYRDKKLVAPIAYSLASVVGFSRLYHNQHWASDVVAGALVGFLSAKATIGVYNFVERKWQQKRQVAIIPQVSGSGGMVTVVVGL